MGNTASILNMIKHIGGDAVISYDKKAIDTAKALILPGVGAFDNAMERIIQNGLLDPLRRRVVDEGVPYVQATHIKKGIVNFDGAYFVKKKWSDAHSPLRQNSCRLKF